eukprot:4846978-Pleurochrysis_carterae.AAC.6
MEPPSLESWAEDRVCLALRSKPDRFRKLLSSEEASRPWNAFVLKPEVQRVFFADGGKELACYALPPDGFKKKILYFLKMQRVALTADTIHEASATANSHERTSESAGELQAEREKEVEGGSASE